MTLNSEYLCIRRHRRYTCEDISFETGSAFHTVMFLLNQQLVSHPRNLIDFVEPEFLFLYSQDPTTDTFSEPDESA
jgi:hypothetical protein